MLSGGTKGLRHVFAELTGKLPDLRLIDVGVSGGIHPVWRDWGSALHAIGIDPLEQEIERLRKVEENANVIYESIKVIAPDNVSAGFSETQTNYMLHRSSAYMGADLFTKAEHGTDVKTSAGYVDEWRQIVTGRSRMRPMQANYANFDEPRDDPFYLFYQRLFERSIGLGSPQVTGATATLDQIVSKHGFDTTDLLKIDTDGFELDVLRGATTTLSGTMAVEVEVQFHGLTEDNANVFSEVDRFLRKAGFSLMKLNPYSYARSALPRPFLYPDLPAQTDGGPIQWADALYFRDMLTYEDPSADARQHDRSLQVAALILDAYGLEDAAAEIILAFPDSFGGVARQLLDALARKIYGSDVNYDAAIKQFLNSTKNYRRH